MHIRQRKKWYRLTAAIMALFATLLWFRSPTELQGPVEQELTRQLQSQIKHYADLVKQMNKDRNKPPKNYELLRRKMYANIVDLWHYANSEIEQLVKDVPELSNSSKHASKIQNFIKELDNRKRSLLSDHKQMAELDGYEGWRQREAETVSVLVQRRLKHLQNPSNCRKAKKVVCYLEKRCGFGCQLHHSIYCLLFAYYTKRTLILRSYFWRYSDDGWNYFFKPLSDTCNSTYGEKASYWPRADIRKLPTEKEKVVKIPKLGSLETVDPKPMFFPLSVPRDLGQRVVLFNGEPASWWIGQLMRYVTRLQPQIQRRIDAAATSLHFKSPIVGMHVRRTDKVNSEAAEHSIHEYMLHVKDYFDRMEMTTHLDVRRVYVASDDVTVLEEARQLYPEYTFLGNRSISQSAEPESRYGTASLEGLLIDLHLLAKCDFVVGTFSSQLGRAVYELMQGTRADASQSFYSLDDIYYFGGQQAHFLYSNQAHKVPKNGTTVRIRRSLKGEMNEIDLEVGDAILIEGNHMDGYGLGRNTRTNERGLFPWYKVTDRMALYPFPEYEQVPLL